MANGPALPVPPSLLRATVDTIPIDTDALARYLSGQGKRLEDDRPRQFAGGYGNLNYLIRVDGAWSVLRRPPLGEIPKGANDMAREFRALSVLSPVWRLAPRPIAFCEDRDVLGAPFLISEFRAGLPLHGTRPLGDGMTPDRARALSATQIDILTELHGFDIHAIGATILGRTEGFAARTLRGWAARFDGAGAQPLFEGRALFERLGAALPVDRLVSVIHNDFKLDNVVVDPVTLLPSAVLDWDMATLGSPFFDLATLLTYWAAPDDPEGLRGINLTHSEAPGAMTRAELADLYLRRRGLGTEQDVEDLRFFLGLAFAKLGVVYTQLHDRFRSDPQAYARNEKFGAAVPGAYALGLAALDGKLI